MRARGDARISGAFVFLLLMVGCGSTLPRGEPSRTPSEWSYAFAIDAQRTRLDARICFRGAVPPLLMPIHSAGLRFLGGATHTGAETSALPLNSRGIDLSAVPRDACIRYWVDLAEAARSTGAQRARWVGDDLIAPTSVWLWMPVPRRTRARVDATFSLPDGMRMSPIWLRLSDGRWRLDERAFRHIAYVAFGRFDVVSVPAPQACVHAVLLGDDDPEMNARLQEGLRQNIQAASLLWGRFPAPQSTVLMTPISEASDVLFGTVGRGSWPSVLLLLGASVNPERMARSWIPVHEFSHLAMPSIARDDAWLSEGVATYYQEILRARAGYANDASVWRSLDWGFRMGLRDGTGRTLREESRAMYSTGSFQRVYWAGAALALYMDVVLRNRDEAPDSLDAALLRLQDCCGEVLRPMTATRALRGMGLGETSALMASIEVALDSTEFPSLDAVYQALGLRRSGERLEVSDEPSARALRQAIISAPALMASGRCVLRDATR